MQRLKTLHAVGVIASVKSVTEVVLHELACTSREALRFLALEPVNFSTTAAYSFVFAALIQS